MDRNERHKQVAGMRRVKLRYFAIALVPIFIFWLNGIIVDHFFPEDLAVPTTFIREGSDWLEAVGRYRFLAATFFFGCISMLAIAMLASNLARPTTRETRAMAIGTVLLILLLATMPTIHHVLNDESSRVYSKIGGGFFEAVLSRGTLPGCNGPDDVWLLGRCGDVPVLSMFNRVMDFVNIFAGLSVGALIVGMILCLETRDDDDVKDAAALLVENQRQVRQQLYLSSLILTFGMFFATSWMHWPLPMVQDADRDAYSSVVLAASLFTGTYFSLLILSFYLPVALTLDARAISLSSKAQKVDSGEGHQSADEWREAQGLKGSASDFLRAGFAIAAPIFAAFAGGISPIAL